MLGQRDMTRDSVGVLPTLTKPAEFVLGVMLEEPRTVVLCDFNIQDDVASGLAQELMGLHGPVSNGNGNWSNTPMI